MPQSNRRVGEDGLRQYSFGRRKDALLTWQAADTEQRAGWDGLASSTELVDLYDERMIGNADVESAYIAVGGNRRGADHWIVNRNVGIRRTEIDSHRISSGRDIRGTRRVVHRGVNPYGDIERRTAAEQERAPRRGQSAHAVVQRARSSSTSSALQDGG